MHQSAAVLEWIYSSHQLRLMRSPSIFCWTIYSFDIACRTLLPFLPVRTSYKRLEGVLKGENLCRFYVLYVNWSIMPSFAPLQAACHGYICLQDSDGCMPWFIPRLEALGGFHPKLWAYCRDTPDFCSSQAWRQTRGD